MINLDQIEEWIHEVESRPSTAPLIIRYIATRLQDLSARNEELLSENIELRTGQKIEDYESRIANLEYQLDLLKRQLGGELNWQAALQSADQVNLIVYNTSGRVVRLATGYDSLVDQNLIATLAAPMPAGGQPRLLATSSTEELLFVFDSGRTQTLPVTDIPEVDPAQREKIEWKNAYLVEPHGNEELMTILPVARMTLFDYCVQISRRGCAKKMMKTSFESHIAKSFVGAGVKAKTDKTCNLVLCGREELFVLVSREGFIWCLAVSDLPYTIEEVMKPSATDYLVTSFALSQPRKEETARQESARQETGRKAGSKQSILIVSHNGKIIHREADWLEKPATFKSRGQAVFSQARREAGARIASAALVDEEADGWCIALDNAGKLTSYKASNLLENGSIPGLDASVEIVDLVTFNVPETRK